MSILLERFAGFWRRGLASLLDEVITMIPSYFMGQAALYLIYFLFIRDTPFENAFSPGMKNYVGIFAGFFVSVPYEIGFHYLKGWTPGKRVLGIVVRDYKTRGPLTLKQCVVRYLGQIVSMIPFGAGYLMAAWDPEKRALHDLMAGTISYTFRKNPLEEVPEEDSTTKKGIDRSQEPSV
jgi:uncharacterized RDD family membrane protein YckC